MEITQEITPKLTPMQELNLKYNKLCNTRGEIEFNILGAQETKSKIEAEIQRLSDMRSSNDKNMKDLQKEAAKLPPAVPATPVPAPAQVPDATPLATASA